MALGTKFGWRNALDSSQRRKMAQPHAKGATVRDLADHCEVGVARLRIPMIARHHRASPKRSMRGPKRTREAQLALVTNNRRTCKMKIREGSQARPGD